MKYWLNREHECIQTSETKPEPIITHERYRGEVVADWKEITEEEYNRWYDYIWRSWEEDFLTLLFR